MTLGALKEFHRRRVQILTEAGPDLLAFETIPNKLEAQVMIISLFVTIDFLHLIVDKGTLKYLSYFVVLNHTCLLNHEVVS